MGSFNLRRSRSPLGRLRKVCPDIKPSDLEGTGEEELGALLKVVEAKRRKQAIGPGGSLGPSWTEMGPNYSPYNTTPLVRPEPWFGGGPFDKGRQEQFPQGADAMTQRQNEAKQFPQASNFPEQLNHSILPGDERWELRVFLSRAEDAGKARERAEEIADAVELYGREMVLIFKDYRDASKAQPMFPQATLTKGADGDS